MSRVEGKMSRVEGRGSRVKCRGFKNVVYIQALSLLSKSQNS